MSKVIHSSSSEAHEESPEKKKGLLAKVIIVAVGVGMAGFGTQSFGLGGASRDIAMEAGNTVMSLSQFEQVKQAVKGQFPDLGDDELKVRAISRAQSQVALVEYSKKQKFSISDKDFARKLKSIFVDGEGAFNVVAYKQAKANLQLTDSEFKSQLTIGSLQEGIQNSAIAVNEEVLPLVLMQQPVRSVKFVTIFPEKKFSDVVASQAEVESFFDENHEQFDLPEKFDISYIDLNKDLVEIEEHVDASELELAYENLQSASVSNEQRESDYLLFGENVELATEVSKQLASETVTWDAALKQYEDKIEDVGEFDLVTKSDAESPEIGEALFSIKNIGQVSSAVKTDYGYMVLRLNDVVKSEIMPFEKVSSDLKNQILNKRRDVAFQKQYELLQNAAFSSNPTFETIKEAVNLDVESLGELTLDSKNGVFSLAKVKAALINEDGNVRKVNEFIKFVEISENRILFLNVDSFTPSKSQKLDEVVDVVKDKATAEKRAVKTTELAEKIQKDLKLNKTLETVASDNNLEITVIPSLSINNIPDGDNLMVGIQMLQQPVQLGTENAQIVDSGERSKAIVITDTVKLADVPDEKALEEVTSRFSTRLGQSDFQNFLNELIENTKFKLASGI